MKVSFLPSVLFVRWRLGAQPADKRDVRARDDKKGQGHMMCMIVARAHFKNYETSVEKDPTPNQQAQSQQQRLVD